MEPGIGEIGNIQPASHFLGGSLLAYEIVSKFILEKQKKEDDIIRLAIAFVFDIHDKIDQDQFVKENVSVYREASVEGVRDRFFTGEEDDLKLFLEIHSTSLLDLYDEEKRRYNIGFNLSYKIIEQS